MLANRPFVEYVNGNGVQDNVMSLNVCKIYSVILFQLGYMEHMPLPGNNHYVCRIGIWLYFLIFRQSVDIMLKSNAVEVHNEEYKKKGNGAGFFVVRFKYF